MEATSTPKVDESGACLARRPRRTKMVTERYASMGCHRLAHDRTLEYIYIYIYIYINISRAETVELRTWISQRSQRQLRPNGMLPDKYLETQTGSSRRGPWSLYVHMDVGRSLSDATSGIRSSPACNRIHLQTHAMWCMCRCPEARLSLEAGACVCWCPEARRAGGWGLRT